MTSVRSDRKARSGGSGQFDDRKSTYVSLKVTDVTWLCWCPKFSLRPVQRFILLSQIYHVPSALLASKHQPYYGNKVMLCFEEDFSAYNARQWVTSFNQRSAIQLTLVTSLPLALFIVQFDDKNLAETKAALLAALPLGTSEIFAAVNDYLDGLDPCNKVTQL